MNSVWRKVTGSQPPAFHLLGVISISNRPRWFNCHTTQLYQIFPQTWSRIAPLHASGKVRGPKPDWTSLGLSYISGSWRIPMRQRRQGDVALPKIWDTPDQSSSVDTTGKAW